MGQQTSLQTSLQRLWTAKWLRIAVLIVFATGLLYQLFDFHVSRRDVRADFDGKVQDANAWVHEEIQNTNFSGIASRMTAIAKVAEVMTANSHLDRKPLMDMLEAQFPWWVQSKPLWTPWNHKQFNTHGSSIIMSVGKGNAHLAAGLIMNLRQVTKSNIPIELAYAGNADLPLRTREALRNLAPDVSLIDMLEVFEDESIELSKGGYAMKPFALLASKYPKTILVDADNVFFESPDRLFDEHPLLLETGMLFYHDRSTPGDTSRSDWVKELLHDAGKEPSEQLSKSLFYSGRSHDEADSGLVAIDKTKPSVFIALMFAAWMNSKVRDEITYEKVYGDKETYWIAPELMGVPYSFQKHYAGQLGASVEHVRTREGQPTRLELCSRQMVHMDATGELPFWANGGLYYDKDNPERGFARWTHWWIGEENRAVGWQWGRDPYGIQWACMQAPAGDVHSFSPELVQKVDQMISEFEKLDALLPE